MEMKMQDKMQNEIYKYLPLWIVNGCKCLNNTQIGEIMEIRLRLYSPVVFVIRGTSWFLGKNSHIHSSVSGEMPLLSKEDLSDIFKKMCSYSFHAYENQISEGFITLNGGHRVGISGHFINDKGSYGVRDITSLNVRVARQVNGCSCKILNTVFSESLNGVLVTAPPACGKTTIIRDMAKKLSEGYLGRYYNVAVIDERGELAGINNGEFSFNLGCCTDVVSGCTKDKGIERAIRTLSPQVIICDEAGTNVEVEAITHGFNSGAVIITTAHASTEEEIHNRPQIISLLSTGAIKYVVMLSSNQNIGDIKWIKEVNVCGENISGGSGISLCSVDWCRENSKHTYESKTTSEEHIPAYLSF